MSANFMSANLFSSMISEKIIDLCGNVKNDHRHPERYKILTKTFYCGFVQKSVN